MNRARISGGRGRRWLLALGSFLLALLSAEALLRAYATLSWRSSIEDLHRRPQLPPPGSRARLGDLVRPSPDARQVFELKPGLDVIFKGVAVRTNEQGWREGPVETHSPAGALRVVGIGDSVMFGWGVEEDRRYMDLLEQKLNRDSGCWRTIVTAVPGYNLMMQVASLKRHAQSLAPDLVVYGWHPNDACLPHFLLERKHFLDPGLFIAAALRGAWERAPQLTAKERLGARCHGEQVPPKYRPISGREPFEAALDELARFSALSGVPVVLLNGLDIDFESAMAMEPPAGVKSVEVAPRVDSPLEGELVLSRRDPHPSPLGHEILARALYEELDKDGLWNRLIARQEPHR